MIQPRYSCSWLTDCLLHATYVQLVWRSQTPTRASSSGSPPNVSHSLVFGASLSEPHLVSSTAALSIYIYHRTSSTRDHLFSTCTVYAVLVPRTNLSFPGLHLRDGGKLYSSRGLYRLPGRSAERSQAIGSDKLAGGSKHM